MQCEMDNNETLYYEQIVKNQQYLFPILLIWFYQIQVKFVNLKPKF